MKQVYISILNQIAENFISKTRDIKGIGLINGKAGVALFLYKYSFYSDDLVYKKTAEQLIDEVCEEMSSIPNLGFSDGLCGIGWCFAYLLQNNFLDDTTDEILLDIDEIILKTQSAQIPFYENNGDFFGAGVYCLARLYTPENNRNASYLLSKTQNVLFLIDECENIFFNHQSRNSNTSLIRPQTLISIVYFILQAYELGLNVKKIKSILSCLPIYFEGTLSLFMDREERKTLKIQIEKARKIVECRDAMHRYDLLSNSHLSSKEASNLAINNLTTDCSKAALYNLVFKRQTDVTKNAEYIREVHQLANDHALVKDLLDRSFYYNLGLNGGLAGMGLSLLDTIKN